MIYKKRPDVRAIVHAHSPALVSFSIVGKLPDTRIIPQAHHVCGQVGFARYALPGSWQLGENIANTFEQGFQVVLLENHGVVTAGRDLLTAFQRLETLDFCARTQIYASGLGPINTLTDEQIARFESDRVSLLTFEPHSHTSRERQLRGEICRMVHRAYEQRLMTSTEGTVSARVNAQGYLITPYGVDRKYLTDKDIVFVQNGKIEQGKRPSRAVELHQIIYSEHADINCIVTAQCPNAMAYAVTGQPLDSKTIPESYVVLRDVLSIPYGQPYDVPERISAALSKRHPAALIQNDTVLTIGATIHEAFDRLEVAEFTAFSLLNTLNIGPLIPIGADEIKELEEKYD
jgi:L-fuculose-phosphate aldolase